MALDAAPATIDTLADLIDRLGGVPLQRVRFRPPPGMATERDVLDVERRESRLCELFQAGVQLVWIVDSDGRSVTVYTASDRGVQLASGDVLHGEPVLPGFRLPLTELFRRLDE